jgi:hypothetical protein
MKINPDGVGSTQRPELGSNLYGSGQFKGALDIYL